MVVATNGIDLRYDIVGAGAPLLIPVPKRPLSSA